jgi:hypothetical protein
MLRETRGSFSGFFWPLKIRLPEKSRGNFSRIWYENAAFERKKLGMPNFLLERLDISSS